MTTHSTGAVAADILEYPWGQNWTSAGDVRSDQHYAGYDELESAAGLYPTLFRKYSPAQGRWLSPDPVGGDITNPQSLNRYAYALNNPTAFTDPLGLFAPGPCIDPNAPGCRNPFIDEFFLNALRGFSIVPVNPDLREIHNRDKPDNKPVISNPSQTGPNQAAIQNAMNRLLMALACDPGCVAFLSGNGVDAVELLTGILKGGYYGHADITYKDDPNTIAAYVGGTEPAGQAITVNNQGAFYLGTVQGIGNLTVGPNNIPGGTLPAQGFILLHELGHLTGVLGPDLGKAKAGKANDKAIAHHCKKTIQSLGQ